MEWVRWPWPRLIFTLSVRPSVLIWTPPCVRQAVEWVHYSEGRTGWEDQSVEPQSCGSGSPSKFCWLQCVLLWWFPCVQQAMEWVRCTGGLVHRRESYNGKLDKRISICWEGGRRIWQHRAMGSWWERFKGKQPWMISLDFRLYHELISISFSIDWWGWADEQNKLQ